MGFFRNFGDTVRDLWNFKGSYCDLKRFLSISKAFFDIYNNFEGLPNIWLGGGGFSCYKNSVSYFIDGFGQEFAGEFEQLQVVVGQVGSWRRVQPLVFGQSEQIQRRVEHFADRFLHELCKYQKTRFEKKWNRIFFFFKKFAIETFENSILVDSGFFEPLQIDELDSDDSLPELDREIRQLPERIFNHPQSEIKMITFTFRIPTSN